MAADNSDLPEMAAKERGKKRVTHLQQATAGKEQQQLAGGVVGCRCFASRHVHCRSSKKEGFIFACWIGEEEEFTPSFL
jgi:hypothetical protein